MNRRAEPPLCSLLKPEKPWSASAAAKLIAHKLDSNRRKSCTLLSRLTWPNIRFCPSSKQISEELEAIVAAAGDPDFRDVPICAYESAMCSSEISRIVAGQVHLDVRHISGTTRDYIDLGIFDTKTGARRMVPVSW